MGWETISGIVNIIIIDLVLSGDNAVVIAMVCMGLPVMYRKKAIFWGTALAVVTRVFLTFVAALLLKIPFVQLVGGLFLAWIAFKLLNPKEEHATKPSACTGDFWKALLTILWADVIMSLDNVLAVAGASGGNIHLLIFGIALSIPVVLAGSTLLTTLLQKYRWLTYVGAGILAWTGGEMIIEDRAVATYLHTVPFVGVIIPLMLSVTILLIGKRVRAARVASLGKI